MMNCIQSGIFLVLFSLLFEDASGSNCSVDSSDKAIVSGDSVSVRCMANESLSTFITLTTITEWRLNNGTSNVLIYSRYDTTIANGYFVVTQSSQQSTLFVNHTVLSNAGIYYCVCETLVQNSAPVKDNASANVIILDGEPWFKQTTAITNAMQAVTCNIAFRGIANSYILIQDISGNNQKWRNDTEAINALNNFTLDYSITSDANVNLTYMCNITLKNLLSQTIFSRSLITSVEWVTTYGPPDKPPTVKPPTTVASVEASKIGLIVGLVVGLSVLLIIVLIITIFILKRTKKRTACCNTEDQKPQTRTETADDKELKNNGKQNPGYEPNGTDETTLVENDLYSGNKHIDPSDGGYASVNEVNSKR